MKHLRLVLFGAFAAIALLLWLQQRDQAVDRAEIHSLEEWGKAAEGRAGVLRGRFAPQLVTATRWRTAWDTVIRIDTLTATDTVRVPVRVLLVADSAVRSCSIALATCQELAALERARADSAERLVSVWRKVARGPLLRPSAELMMSGARFRVAGELEAGRRLTAVARLEVDTLPRFWAGLRYQF